MNGELGDEEMGKVSWRFRLGFVFGWGSDEEEDFMYFYLHGMQTERTRKA
jgi:hypothetical protein